MFDAPTVLRHFPRACPGRPQGAAPISARQRRRDATARTESLRSGMPFTVICEPLTMAVYRYSPATLSISEGVWMEPPIKAMRTTSALP